MSNKFTEKFFHDTAIANGYLPLPLVERIFNYKIAQTESKLQ